MRVHGVVATMLFAQYVLGFAPGRDNAFHRLRVTVTRGGVKTRHRDGYYPPPSR